MHRTKPIVVTGMAIMVVVAGIGAGVAAQTSPGSNQGYGASTGCVRAAQMAGRAETPLTGLNDLVSQSDAAIIATVSAISLPRWNSSTGDAWCTTDNEPGTRHALAFQYRNVTLDLKETLFASERIDTNQKQLTVSIPGDGQLTSEPADRARITGEGFDVSTYEFSENIIHLGETALLLLRREQVDTKEGISELINVSSAALGKWNVSSGRATSPVPNRDADSFALKQRIKDERAAGRKKLTEDEQRKSAINPLGG